MKVKEFIAELQKQNPELNVVCKNYGDDDQMTEYNPTVRHQEEVKDFKKVWFETERIILEI